MQPAPPIDGAGTGWLGCSSAWPTEPSRGARYIFVRANGQFGLYFTTDGEPYMLHVGQLGRREAHRLATRSAIPRSSQRSTGAWVAGRAP